MPGHCPVALLKLNKSRDPPLCGDAPEVRLGLRIELSYITSPKQKSVATYEPKSAGPGAVCLLIPLPVAEVGHLVLKCFADPKVDYRVAIIVDPALNECHSQCSLTTPLE